MINDSNGDMNDGKFETEGKVALAAAFVCRIQTETQTLYLEFL
jgi:hypothetical protein